MFLKENVSTLRGKNTLYSNFTLCLNDEIHVITYEHSIFNLCCTVVFQENKNVPNKKYVDIWGLVSKSCTFLKDTTPLIQMQL